MGRYIEERSEQEIVRFLAKLLEQRIPAVRCEYSAHSPFAYSYPLVEDFFSLASHEAVELLEDLVTEGLLDRRLADKVHVCPSCGWHTLNFVEVCPRCRSVDIDIEKVLHHFACAYVGPWSEFKRGMDLICPKCDEQLRHMGLDYERPANTYVCSGCGYAFNDSTVQIHCFRCNNTAKAEEATPQWVYEYVPNPKASRAVECGRVHGLDIKSVLLEDSSRTFRRDFLIFEIDREIYRARRYDSSLSMILLDVHGLDASPDVKDNVDKARVQNEVFEQIAGALRDLDVVSAASDGWAAILLPETPLPSAVTVAERLQSVVSEFQSVSIEEPISSTVAVGELLPTHERGNDFLDYVHQMLVWALENRAGTVVSAETWERETRNA